jgi:bifunctional polynucleotide phosphatase/kinase
MSILYKNFYKDTFPAIINLISFDLDYTLIKTKSGNVFPKDNSDWLILYPEVKPKLKELSTNKHNIIVIFSNQKGVKDETDFMIKINNIHKLLEIDFIFIAALEDDIFRKPRNGMFRYLKKELNVKINKKNSFYVGDMAGRENDKYDTDFKFAHNIGVQFYTPEEFFLGRMKEPYTLKGYLLNSNHKSNKHIKIDLLNNKYMVIISGYPGSGKTYLAEELKKKYNFDIISKDIYGIKFNKKLIEQLEINKSVIVEGLYYNNTSRNELKKLASQYNYTTIYIHMTTSYELSYHMNLFRKLYEDKSYVPEIVYMKYRKNFEHPSDSDWGQLVEYHPIVPDKINKYYLF